MRFCRILLNSCPIRVYYAVNHSVLTESDHSANEFGAAGVRTILSLPARWRSILTWNIASFSSLYLLQALFSLDETGFSRSRSVLASVVIVQVQLGQTAGMNVGAKSPFNISRRTSWLLFTLSSSPMVLILFEDSYPRFAGLIIVSSITGVRFGLLLARDPERSGQLSLARNAAWLAFSLVLVRFCSPYIALPAALLAATFIVVSTMTTRVALVGEAEPFRPRHSALVAAAVCTGSFYRNDVSFTRAHVPDSVSFSINGALIFYAAANGLMGVFCGQVLIPRMRAENAVFPHVQNAAGLSSKARLNRTISLAVAALTAISLSVWLINSSRPVPAAIVIFCSIPASLAVTYLATLFHFYGRSITVYICATLAALVPTLLTNKYAIIALTIENACLVLVFLALPYRPGLKSADGSRS